MEKNELLVDKSLLINDFETYKLSLEEFRMSREIIPEEIEIKHPSSDQYSFLHHKEFSLHNFLYCDVWNENNVYLINSEGKVKKVLLNPQIQKLFGLLDVWFIPKRTPNTCNFNISITFPSPHLGVISDGSGSLYIINTSNRNEDVQWKMIHSEDVLGEPKEFKVISSLLTDGKEKGPRKLYCVLLLIEASISETLSMRNNSGSRGSGFETVLKLVQFMEESGGKWSKTSISELRGAGSSDYIYLEPGCDGLYIISESEFYSPDARKRHLQQHNQANDHSSEEPVSDYIWEQTADDIKLWLEIPSNAEKIDLKVIARTNFLEVFLKESSILSGYLFQQIDSNLTSWTFHNSKLEIVMQKEEIGEVWKCLFKDDSKIGKEVINEEFVAQVHEKLAHLCSESEEQAGTAILNTGELEECDAFGESKFLFRFQINTGEITHKILLGNDQWLFPLQLTSDRVPAFCIRRDIDGLVWQPLLPKNNAKLFECVHTHTFPAFGYIAASRQDKKFLIAPPNLSYVAIINCVGHVIVFRKSNLSGGSLLRNRKTSVTTSSYYVQNLVNLETSCQTIGAVAWNQYLFVLTAKELIMINVNT